MRAGLRRAVVLALALGVGSAQAVTYCNAGQAPWSATGESVTGTGDTFVAACTAWEAAYDAAQTSSTWTLTQSSSTQCTATKDGGSITKTAVVTNVCTPPVDSFDFNSQTHLMQALMWLCLVGFFFHGLRYGDRLV